MKGPGFTLIEVLVALALVMVLASLVVSVTLNLARTSDRSSMRAEQHVVVSELIERIDAALFAAVPTNAVQLEQGRLRIRSHATKGGTTTVTVDPSAMSLQIDGGDPLQLDGVSELEITALVRGSWQSQFAPSASLPSPEAIACAFWLDRDVGSRVSEQGLSSFVSEDDESTRLPDRWRVFALLPRGRAAGGGF